MNRRRFLSLFAKLAAVVTVAPTALQGLTTGEILGINMDPLTPLMFYGPVEHTRLLDYDYDRVDAINMEKWGKVLWKEPTWFDQESASTFPQHFPVARHHK